MYNAFLKCVRAGACSMFTDWRKYLKDLLSISAMLYSNIGLASSFIYLEQVSCLWRKYFCPLWRVTPEIYIFFDLFCFFGGEGLIQQYSFILSAKEVYFVRTRPEREPRPLVQAVHPYVGPMSHTKKQTSATKAVRIWNSLWKRTLVYVLFM